jgi:glyoxylase-like metal-dependent hydrolase (beta-lactamase superfamily II)
MFENYDNVYNFWFENGASSVTFLEYDDGLIAFDSSLYPRKFEDMIKIVEERTSKKLKKVFFTHFHPDHTFGAVFSKRKFDLYMNKKTLDFLNTLDTTFLKESSKVAEYNFNNFKEALKEKDIVIFENSIFLFLKDQILSAENIGGHTLDSTIYILKPQGYLISGDLVFSKVHAEILNSNVDEWISRLNSLSSLDIETVFPGHGKPGSKKLLREQLTYLKSKKSGEDMEKRHADYSLPDLAHL